MKWISAIFNNLPRILLVVFITMFFSCESNNQSIDEEKLNVFSSEEKAIVKDIVSQFDQLVLGYMVEKDTIKAYKEFLNYLKYNQSSNDFALKIEFFSKGACKIFNDYEGKPIFREFWEYSYILRDTNLDDTLWIEVKFSRDGKYMKFLADKASENEFFNNYYLTIEATGSNNNPILMNSIPQNLEAFDLNRIDDRFIVAMHYISLSSVPMLEQERSKEKEVKSHVQDSQLDSSEESGWDEYYASFKIENYTMDSTPGSDIKVIDKKAIIFVSPDSIEVEQMIKEMGDDFYIVADDNSYYRYEAKEYMVERGIEPIYLKSRYIKFSMQNAQNIYVDVKSPFARGWTTFIFRTDSLPKIISPVDIDFEYKKYFVE